MAYNNGFPATYPQMYYAPQYQMQNPYLQGTQMSQANPQQPQAMTPPTIHADIIQVESEADADRYPMAAGSAPQMFILRDESAFFIKTLLANNSHELTTYVKRPPKPQAPAVDMDMYVTKDELEKRLAAISGVKAAHAKEDA